MLRPKNRLSSSKPTAGRRHDSHARSQSSFKEPSMNQAGAAPAPLAQPHSPSPIVLPPTPVAWRLALLAGVVALAGLAYGLEPWLGMRGRAVLGVMCVLGIVAMLSANLRAVNLRTLGFGLILQVALALLVIRVEAVREVFVATGDAVKKFLEFSEEGARFVFGPLAHRLTLENVFGPDNNMIFAFSALPPIIFVSSFFTVLYYLGVLQFIVRLMARGMVYLMQTSGAESLSSAANVFMGQTEAPLIVKPYVVRMTQSELLALMVGGMATISGGLMAVYIGLGADQVAILTTSVMAAPCSLYLAKLMLPELEEPETRGVIKTPPEKPHRNVIDAAAGGASDGLFLALNVAAMLIAFLAFLALVNYFLGQLATGQSLWQTLREAEGWMLFWSVVLIPGSFWLFGK